MTTITSLQNPRVKDAIRLRNGRHRVKQRRILIDGIRELARALDGRIDLVEVFICWTCCTRRQVKILSSMLGDFHVEILYVSEQVFEKLAFGDRSEGVVAVAETPMTDINSLTMLDNPLIAVLEGVEKPGNVGAVIRSADGAGVSAVIAADGRTDLFNPNIIRASLGTVFTMPVCEAASGTVLEWLRENGLTIYAARVDGSVPYTEIDYRGPTAIVFGSETKGLSSVWDTDDITPVRLPMLGAADSLNISATAAVLFYEALRQRG